MLVNGAFLLMRREMRQQILFEFTGQIRCCMATKQLLHGDAAIKFTAYLRLHD